MSAAASKHIPVLRERCLELLAGAGGSGVIIDGTLGMGGHSEAILAHTDYAVVGIDRDPQAIALATERLAPYGDRFTTVHTTYDHIADIAASTGPVRGILMDLGVSSLQLDSDDRGFAYSRNTPLDMRMDTDGPRTAADILAQASVGELTRILRVYGEERAASRIAAAIVRERESAPITTTGQLADLIDRHMPAPARRSGGNPAKRTFQALRIAVNSELSILAQALPQAVDALDIGGRLVVMSYHSLEDRLVKAVISQGTQVDAPAGLPIIPDDAQPYLRALTRGAEKASSEEIERNPRSAPVRLRAAEKLHPAPAHRNHLEYDQVKEKTR